MKLLFFRWDSVCEPIILKTLKKMRHEVICIQKKMTELDLCFDKELSFTLLETAHQEKIDAFFSINYIPILSSICTTLNLPYYSWVYDCPHYTLYAEQAKLPCNHIYIFDALLCQRLLDRGYTTVSHLPLAAEVKDFATSENTPYSADISFVGSLYDQFAGESSKKNPLINSLVNELMQPAIFLYGREYLDYMNTLETDEDILALLALIHDEKPLLTSPFFTTQNTDVIIPNFLEKKITHLERVDLFETIASHSLKATPVRSEHSQNAWDFHLYTGSALTNYSADLQACGKGRVNYHTQMPLVFLTSKINLNLTLRSIRSGIPQRVLDIMGCGGFVLTNYQPELAEFFDIGKELAVFYSKEDCMDKISYYLSHEDERKEIARCGYEKIRSEFTYEKMLNICLQ